MINDLFVWLICLQRDRSHVQQDPPKKLKSSKFLGVRNVRNHGSFNFCREEFLPVWDKIRKSLKKKHRKKHFSCAAYRANTGRALEQEVKKFPENPCF